MSLHVQVRGGEIGSFESVKLEIIFTPTIPGETRLDFSFKFSDKTSKPVRNSLFFSLVNYLGSRHIYSLQSHRVNESNDMFSACDWGLIQTDTHPCERCGSQHACMGTSAQHWPKDLHVWPPLSRHHHCPKQVSPRAWDGCKPSHLVKLMSSCFTFRRSSLLWFRRSTHQPLMHKWQFITICWMLTQCSGL